MALLLYRCRVEDGAQSIDRAARILVRLMESDNAVSFFHPVVADTRLPKSTAARLLRALERNGLAQRRREGGFRPGPVLVEYARRDAFDRRPGPRSPWPFLERLGRETGETVNVAVPAPAGSCTSRADRHRPSARGRQLGLGRPADSPPRMRPRWESCSWPTAPCPASPTAGSRSSGHDRSRPRRRAGGRDRTRPEGRRYATTRDELEEGLCSAAAPVHGSSGNVIAAISVSAPTVRTDARTAGRALAAPGRRRGRRPLRRHPHARSRRRTTRDDNEEEILHRSLRLDAGREQAGGRTPSTERGPRGRPCIRRRCCSTRSSRRSRRWGHGSSAATSSFPRC